MVPRISSSMLMLCIFALALELSSVQALEDAPRRGLRHDGTGTAPAPAGTAPGGTANAASCTARPCSAALLNNVAVSVVSEKAQADGSFTTDSTTGGSGGVSAGENIYGPFEAGFGTTQDNILGGYGCNPTSNGYIDGGLDTVVAEQVMAHNCSSSLGGRSLGTMYTSMSCH